MTYQFRLACASIQSAAVVGGNPWGRSFLSGDRPHFF